MQVKSTFIKKKKLITTLIDLAFVNDYKSQLLSRLDNMSNN